MTYTCKWSADLTNRLYSNTKSNNTEIHAKQTKQNLICKKLTKMICISNCKAIEDFKKEPHMISIVWLIDWCLT